MKFVFGTGSSPAVYLVMGLALVLAEDYHHDGPVVLMITVVGFLILAELARIRDEIRKFNE